MRELRIGLVLYGGVSLAVYMNGIVTELWQLLRASKALANNTADSLNGTAQLYGRFLDQLGKGEDSVGLRVVVDAIAGTSAGGVNGAVLGKAIVEGGDATVLNDIWLNEADIAKLGTKPYARTPFYLRALLWLLTPLSPLRTLRRKLASLGLEWPWVRDQAWSLYKNRRNGRCTPLDGDYFAERIAAALGRLENTGSLLPSAARLDLFLTRTDFFGWPRHLPVSESYHPDSLQERTHAHVMHFHAKPGDTLGDFALTYAARTTAGFPGAFAPCSVDDILKSFTAAQPTAPGVDLDAFAVRHLGEHKLTKFEPKHAWMIDGGVLDNKPFTQLARAIESKPADRQVKRVLMYLEPDPEIGAETGSAESSAREHAPVPKRPPAPLDVIGGMYGLLRHEPIFDDLNDLRERNAQVRRIQAAIMADAPNADRYASAALKQTSLASLLAGQSPDAAQLKDWRSAIDEFLAHQSPSGYPAYVALRLDRASRVLAALLCSALDFPYPSAHAYFVRRLSFEWLVREGAVFDPTRSAGSFDVTPARGALLNAFDLPFRQRRLRHVVQVVNRQYANASIEARVELDALKASLATVAESVAALFETTGQVRDHIIAAFGGIKTDAINAAITLIKNNPSPIVTRYDNQIRSLYQTLSANYAARIEALDREVESALARASARLDATMRGELLRAALAFPFVDLIAFPLMESAGLEDLITVEVMRLSPADSTTLSPNPHRLKSRALGAFMGFLKRDAREHDLMWGRLDSADRLVELLVKAASRTDKPTPALMSIGASLRRDLMRATLAEQAPQSRALKDIVEGLRHTLGTA